MENKSFETITDSVIEYVNNRFDRSRRTISRYRECWRGLRNFMAENQVNVLDIAVCEKYLITNYSDDSVLSLKEKEDIFIINMVMDYLSTGEIHLKHEKISLEGPLSDLMNDYLNFKISQRLHESTNRSYACHLSRFNAYLKKRNVQSVKDINSFYISDYLIKISPVLKSNATQSIMVLRGFFKYLYDKKIIEINLASTIPRVSGCIDSRLPSTYSTEEIGSLLNSVNRNTSSGKRDYAVILLASRLGLRASDIAYLSFENILWDKSIIKIRQYKTNQETEYPLLPEIGNAIIDWLKNGRQEIEDPTIFHSIKPPIRSIRPAAVGSIVRNNFARSGINTRERQKGAHSLRHSLAQRLLEKKTMLPVISEVLGHNHTASTRYYLRIDLTSLQQCVLDVPDVVSDFYNQLGGYFYE
ncbi:MAG: tyrosine-type recombinase/integrase [Prevotella sp.]|jgi:site-specific recombinase XerD|nr:tyrosine-type recombinase/integrase [Prevotella sp.]